MRSRRLCPVPPASPSGPARVGLSVAEPGKLLIPASLLSLIHMFIDVSMFMSEKTPKNRIFRPSTEKNSPLLSPSDRGKATFLDRLRRSKPEETEAGKGADHNGQGDSGQGAGKRGRTTAREVIADGGAAPRWFGKGQGGPTTERTGPSLPAESARRIRGGSCTPRARRRGSVSEHGHGKGRSPSFT
jgi:hypothetical protein